MGLLCYVFDFFFSFLFLAFYGFVDSTAEEGDRKQGERGGGGHAAKGPRQGVHSRASAYGTPALPTELNGALTYSFVY